MNRRARAAVTEPREAIEGKIEIGDLVRDKVTKFEGIATGTYDFMWGCRRISIQPRTLKDDGSVKDDHVFDEPQVEILEKGTVDVVPLNPDDLHLKLGDEVQDVVTTFKGVVVAIFTLINGSRTVAVQPQGLTKDNGVAESKNFNADQLTVTKKKVIDLTRPKHIKEPGGPAPYLPTNSRPSLKG